MAALMTTAHPAQEEQSAVQDLIEMSLQHKFFTDPDSPFPSAPEPIKQILLNAKDANGCLVCDNIILDSLVFEPRPTDNHSCMYMFTRHQDTYYHCFECTGQNWETDRVIFCAKCFIVQDHQGHHYYSQICHARQCYCDCGSKDKTSSTFKCSHHAEDKNIEIIIDEGERQNFIGTFKAFLEVGCYLSQSGSLLGTILEKLQQLCQNSAYYSKLTLQLLLMQSKYLKDVTDSPANRHFLAIIAQNEDIGPICVQICANNDLQLRLATYLIEDFRSNQQSLENQANLTNFSTNLIFSFNVLRKLMDMGIYNRLLFNKYEFYANQVQYKKGGELFNKYLINIIDSSNSQQAQLTGWLLGNQKIISTPELACSLLKHFIKYYPPIQNSKLDKKKANKKSKKNNKKKTEREVLTNDVRHANQVIMHSILVMTEGDRVKLENFRVELGSYGIDVQKFEDIFVEIVYHANEYLYNKTLNSGNETPVSMISLLLLIKGSAKCDQLMNLLWVSLLGTHLRYENIVANIYEMVSAVVWSEIHLLLYQITLQKIHPKPKPLTVEQQKKMREFFVLFLALKQVIPRQDLIDMKKQKMLEVSEMGKILRTTCNYDEEDEAFYYNSQPAPPKFMNKFALFFQESSVPAMCASMYSNTDVYAGFENDVEKFDLLAYQKELLTTVLKATVLEQIVALNWQKASKQTESEEKAGYLYLFILVLINGFTQSNTTKSKLQAIKSIILKKQPNIYSKSQSETLCLQRLLKINRNEIKNTNGSIDAEDVKKDTQLDQTEKKREEDERRRKFEQKKKKISQRYLDKRKAALQFIQSKSIDGSLQSHEQICLTCHQKNRANDELVYLGRVGANNSLSRTVHGEQDKANTSLFTCFHCLHVSCFITSHKISGSGSTCPLCNDKINCFFMRDYEKSTPQTKTIFSNTLVSSLLADFKVYDTQNYFIVFFKHFVQAKGLKQLVSRAQNWHKHKITDKSDGFLEYLMTTIYHSAEEKKRDEYNRSIQKFISSLEGCKNEAIKLVQLIMSHTLKQKLLNKQSAKHQIPFLLQLQSILKSQQFMIIKQEVESLLNDQVILPQSHTTSEKESEKVSLSFKPRQLPIDSTKFNWFLLNNLCSKNHDRKMDFFCLICGKGICEECNDENYQLDHYGLSAYISVQNFMLTLRSSSTNEQSNIYFNDLRVPYSERSDRDLQQEVYTLNVMEYSALMQEFLG